MVNCKVFSLHSWGIECWVLTLRVEIGMKKWKNAKKAESYLFTCRCSLFHLSTEESNEKVTGNSVKHHTSQVTNATNKRLFLLFTFAVLLAALLYSAPLTTCHVNRWTENLNQMKSKLSRSMKKPIGCLALFKNCDCNCNCDSTSHSSHWKFNFFQKPFTLDACNCINGTIDGDHSLLPVLYFINEPSEKGCYSHFDAPPGTVYRARCFL